jgi:N-methylhydantoinase A
VFEQTLNIMYRRRMEPTGSSAPSIGVDVGGTFTDLVWRGGASGDVRADKLPSTPQSPDEGVLALVDRAVPPAALASAAVFVHGTTVGLNALLQGRRPTIGLVCTAGLRDVLEIGRGNRGEAFNLLWRPKPPLVPRHLRMEVRERVLGDGSVRDPLVVPDVAAVLERFQAMDVELIAVALINAYANPEHELAVEAELRRLGFEGHVSLSHRISGEYREYERTCTTIVDAIVRGPMGSYLRRLESGLAERGFTGEVLVTRSGGGAMTFADAQSRPVETILSGPVAGAIATAQLARRLGLPSAIAADVGGTSFDTCLITDGEVPVLYEGEILDLPLQVPWVDVRSIGAGGGSIAYVDAGGLLRVGPRSAGAQPGPACYGRGGTEPTVTDAALLLGMLPQQLASGMDLDAAASEQALAPLGEALGMTTRALAEGVMRIAAASMAEAIRTITVEHGKDPREAALVVFGGAGPQFGTLLAEELDIHTIVVPPLAGNFSAWGLLNVDLAQTVSRTVLLPLDEHAIERIEAHAAKLFAGMGDGGDGVRQELRLDMRYVGQEHTLTVEVPWAAGRVEADVATISADFERDYARAFQHVTGEPVEVLNVRALVRANAPERAGEGRPAAAPAQAAPGGTTAWSFAAQEHLTFAVVERDAISADAWTQGPAIVVEPTATTYIDTDVRFRTAASGALILERQA